MSAPLRFPNIARILLPIAFAAVAACVNATPALQAALAGGISPTGTPKNFASPQLGPEVTCGGVSRQFAVLNPNAVPTEPIILRFILRAPLNPTELPRIATQFTIGGDIRILIVPPNGPAYEFKGTGTGGTAPTGNLTMLGFGYHHTDMRLAMDQQTVTGAAFEFPGLYRVRVGMRCYTNTGSDYQPMGDFTITIGAGRPEDKVAVDILNDFKIFQFFQTRVTHSAEGRPLISPIQLQALERLEIQCPKSVLRPHTMLILADFYARRDSLAKAIATYEAIRREYPDTPFAGDALFQQLSLHEVEYADEKARALFDIAWQSPSMTLSILPGSPGWKRYAAPHLPPSPDEAIWFGYERPPLPAADGSEDLTLDIGALLRESEKPDGSGIFTGPSPFVTNQVRNEVFVFP